MDEDHKMNCIAKQVSKPWYRSYRVKVKRLEGGLILFVLPSWEESSYILKGGLGAAWKIADISEGSNVVIFGLGTVGLSVAQGAKLRGASRIIGVDVNPEKYEKGKAFGITEFINPNDCNEPVHQGWGLLTYLCTKSDPSDNSYDPHLSVWHPCAFSSENL
ncbi:hypothetical protein HHK36_031641 [Tetracentron sinense]|uniref:Alcohol dehydrogenase-like C-terminal domain-containing protein n=1 Tax=Tetracentron sinense TaxID=13715 RepID=A0A835CYD4_TETSI|nr:hypothetical protein HHK36_031641 [Tetracentron sinense]